MGTSRIAGVLGISDQPINIDDGTLSRGSSPTPGVAGLMQASHQL